MLPQGHKRELKIPKYQRTNNGRKMNENMITKMFSAEWPSVLKMNVKRTKKSMMTAMDTIALRFKSVKNVKRKTIKSNEINVITRKGDLIIIITNPFKFKKFHFPVNASGIACQFPVCAQYPVAGNDYGYGIVSDCTAYSLGRHFRRYP